MVDLFKRSKLCYKKDIFYYIDINMCFKYELNYYLSQIKKLCKKYISMSEDPKPIPQKKEHVIHSNRRLLVDLLKMVKDIKEDVDSIKAELDTIPKIEEEEEHILIPSIDDSNTVHHSGTWFNW
mgnify:CR=1 FL=1